MASPPARGLLKLNLVVILVATLLVQAQSAPQQSDAGRAERHHAEVQPKVAIIGAGIGGAFTAYNLRQLLNSTVELHM